MSINLIHAFWHEMNGNDWQAVAERFLSPNFTLSWPQTSEIIEGREQFATINAAFPGQGGWRFEVIALTGAGSEAASDTRITQPDLGITARALTFHRLEAGLIATQTEFWPAPYPVPDWRRGMVQIDPLRARF